MLCESKIVLMLCESKIVLMLCGRAHMAARNKIIKITKYPPITKRWEGRSQYRARKTRAARTSGNSPLRWKHWWTMPRSRAAQTTRTCWLRRAPAQHTGASTLGRPVQVLVVWPVQCTDASALGRPVQVSVIWPVQCTDASDMACSYTLFGATSLNFEYNDRRNKIIPNEVQANTHEHQA